MAATFRSAGWERGVPAFARNLSIYSAKLLLPGSGKVERAGLVAPGTLAASIAENGFSVREKRMLSSG